MKIMLEGKKKIALIAHDNKKDELVKWAVKNKDVLSKHMLCGTGTTSKRVSEATSLNIHQYKSGPLGGDQEIGAAIVNQEVDMLIFFWDTLEAQPHDPDVKALLRIAVLYNIPIAMNVATADFLISSLFMNSEYKSEL